MSDFTNNQPQQTPPIASKTDGMAIASLILGITSFFCCGIPGIN